MNKTNFLLFILICAIDCLSSMMYAQTSIEIRNTLDFSRKEIVAISVSELRHFINENEEINVRIKTNKNQYIPIQWIDYDGDGKNDELLFQVNIAARKTENYILIVDAKTPPPISQLTTYSRLVPERVDDYTWENDKIAFRVYGPKGQQEALEGIQGSTLSSGVDIWLKKTDKSIINKWYKGYLTDPMYYHKDTRGEGYDPYHVGNSRGTGGIGIWNKDSLQVSENFVSSKTIAEGPLRTVFELTYNPWSEYGIRETKRISLDLGSNFSKFESIFDAKASVPNYTIGITLHKNDGKVKLNDKSGYYLHWEKIDDAFVGEGVVVDPNIVEKSIAYTSEIPDQSNILIVTQPQKKLIYYAGFAWQKSGQVQTQKDWENMLQKQAPIIAHPLVVKIK
ncbi:DUF4861 domain-containing protein [Chryseobacterium nematophagum]|uniref:DUF4861 domain-containing protein n=1 Tax=Chryseobacterium nematophagum TaxID=2305228 RepID=A0A3M7TD58_9FLAO|nr:DUF4861 family protein [Chryseobacterium nematophagum]RNA61522.1 DUF4861 domain-containing protein [Chryseobacterium nematophagum]